MAGKGVQVSVERLLEQEVCEISRNGEETYIRPLTFSEELASLAAKVDFHEGWDKSEDEDDEIVKGEAESAGNEKKVVDLSKLPEQWPWEDVRSKLRNALSEVCVLLDVLQTLKEKKYLVLDPVNQAAEPPKPTVQMLGKRKCLAKAGDVIRKGGKQMKVMKVEDPMQALVVEDIEIGYYMELMKLRQFWRLKKTGNMITGDLSYKTAGSMFWHPGLFEVKKSEVSGPETDNDWVKCPLTVTVSADLEGFARILVDIKDRSDDPVQDRDIQQRCMEEIVPPWQKKLKQAQYNLFCKELFSQLSREAFQFKAVETEQVAGDLISCKLFPKVDLELRYMNSESEPIKGSSSRLSLMLEHKLHALLHEQHKRNIDLPIPHPSTTFWGSRQPAQAAIHSLLNRATPTSRKGILQDFLDAARHAVNRERINMYFERKCIEISTPNMSCHWNALPSSTQSSAVVSIVSECSADRVRTSFLLTVNVSQCRVLYEDGCAVDIPVSVKDLDHIVELQIGQHLISVVRYLARKYGWTLIQVVSSLPWKLQPSCDASNGVVMRSPMGDKSLAIRIGSEQTIEVDIYRPPMGCHKTLDELLGARWQNLDLISDRVDWLLLKGESFMEKCEGLMVLVNK